MEASIDAWNTKQNKTWAASLFFLINYFRIQLRFSNFDNWQKRAIFQTEKKHSERRNFNYLNDMLRAINEGTQRDIWACFFKLVSRRKPGNVQENFDYFIR